MTHQPQQKEGSVLFNLKNNFRNNPNTQLRSDLGLLAQELSGILNWMLDGADDLAKNKGFVITEEQTRMLDEYRQENSSVEGFIAECLEFDPEEEMKARTLYEYYKQWCQRDGRKFKSNIAFTKEMKAFGVKTGSFSFKERENGRNGSRYCGVKMCEDTGLIKGFRKHRWFLKSWSKLLVNIIKTLWKKT